MFFTAGLRGSPSVWILESPYSLAGLVHAGRSRLRTFSAVVYFLRKRVVLRWTVSVGSLANLSLDGSRRRAPVSDCSPELSSIGELPLSAGRMVLFVFDHKALSAFLSAPAQLSLDLEESLIILIAFCVAPSANSAGSNLRAFSTLVRISSTGRTAGTTT